MKIVVKIAIFMLAVVIMVMPAVACGEPTAPSEPAEPTPTLKKITLADAPMVLDLSPLLPASFEHLDAASEGFSNEDMGLGPEASEVELFLSEEPYQMIYGFLMVIEESQVERAASNAIFRDEQQIKSIVAEGLKAGAAEEGLEIGASEIQVTYPSIADIAVLGEGSFSSYGINVGFDILWFRENNVYVFTYSVYLSPEKQPLVSIAREIEHRIGMFSQ